MSLLTIALTRAEIIGEMSRCIDTWLFSRLVVVLRRKMPCVLVLGLLRPESRGGGDWPWTFQFPFFRNSCPQRRKEKNVEFAGSPEFVFWWFREGIDDCHFTDVLGLHSPSVSVECFSALHPGVVLITWWYWQPKLVSVSPMISSF